MVPRPEAISPALERVLTRFAATVRSVGRRHGLADTDVDELLQDVRIRLWRALGSGERIEGALSSYVYRTASSAAVDLIRRRREQGRRMTDAFTDAGHPDPIARDRPDRAAEEAELGESIARAVDGLSSTRRAPVRMYLAGYHTGEIASLLGWTEAKARNLVYRGLQDLRERLTAMGIGPEATT